MPVIQERTIFLVLLVSFVFLALNFNRDVGFLFLLLLLTDYVFFDLDNKVEFPFERTATGRIAAFVFATILIAGFLLTATVLLSVLSETQSVTTLLSTTTPPLADSAILTFLTWAVLIPFVETRFFFGRLQEVILDFVRSRNIPTSKQFTLTSPGTWIAAFIIAGLFMILHLAAKGVTNTSALALTFLFGLVSFYVTLWFQQTRENVLFHIGTNSLAVGKAVGSRAVQALIGVNL